MIAPFLIALLAVLGFALALMKAKLVDSANALFAVAMNGIGAMFDKELDDDAKEMAVRRAGIALLGRSLDLGLRFALALAAAATAVFLAAFAGIAPAADVFALMLRLDFILGVSLVAIAFGYLVKRRQKRAAKSIEAGNGPSNSMGDQLVHSLAFASPAVMRGLLALDDRLNAKNIRRVQECPPVFVTSLARGGTTALLNAFHDLPAIATHEYRDMPFITAPATWARLGRDRTARVVQRERAHGDGIRIGLDSPEAFDEVLWQLYWPHHYTSDGIEPWLPADIREDAVKAFHRHFSKIVFLRRPDQAKHGAVRYLSKNNANIARLGLLPEMFPGCTVIVPVRNPAAHAASLLRQHRNFLHQHAEDNFTRRYMADIGHFEFGEIHKPLRFPGFDPGLHDTETGDYWLAYWLAGFRSVLEHSKNCHFVFQDDLRSHPQKTMEKLCQTLDTPASDLDFSAYFRSSPDQSVTDVFSPDLLAQANALYARLRNLHDARKTG